MKKIGEEINNNYSLKRYLNDKKSSILEFIDILEKNEIAIIRITVNENVEQDMKQYDGDTFSSESLRKYYQYIKENGMFISYDIFCIYNDIRMHINLSEDTNEIILISEDKDIELDDLMQKKNERNFR